MNAHFLIPPDTMQLRTKRNYNFSEVSSAMQKAIRRGDAQLAGYWALELWSSGFGRYVWKRLLTVSAVHHASLQRERCGVNGESVVFCQPFDGIFKRNRLTAASDVRMPTRCVRLPHSIWTSMLMMVVVSECAWAGVAHRESEQVHRSMGLPDLRDDDGAEG